MTMKRKIDNGLNYFSTLVIYISRSLKRTGTQRSLPSREMGMQINLRQLNGEITQRTSWCINSGVEYRDCPAGNDTTYAEKISGNFCDRTLRLSSLCLRSPSLIYPISFWISENGLGFCLLPTRRGCTFLFGLGYILCALRSALFPFFFFPRFYSRCAIQLSCRWPCLNLFQEFHGEHGFLHANATNFSLSLVLLFRCCVHACLDIVMFKRLQVHVYIGDI